MPEFIRIGRIATLADEGTNEFCFEYENKQWQVIEALRGDFPEITIVMKFCSAKGIKSSKKFLKFKEFCNNGNTSLDLFYKNKYAHYLEGKSYIPLALNALYKNYKEILYYAKSTEKETDGENNTYVTNKLYDHLYDKHQSEDLGSAPLALPICFRPELREYQKRTVRWLLKREGKVEILKPFYNPLVAKAEELRIFKHMYCMAIEEEEPHPIHLPCGGILADEMGLGKTVEIIALTLLNARRNVSPPAFLKEYSSLKKRKTPVQVFCTCVSKSNHDLVQCRRCSLWQHKKCVQKFNGDHPDEVNEPYLCPQCWNELLTTSDSLVETAATFIVSPNSIRTQWLREMKQHVQPNLRVLVYDGIAAGWISPRQMANYDVVLTDYNVLRSEVYYTNDNVPQRKTRNKPQSIRMQTPLMMLEWWRVCLDEAQVVESNVSKLSGLVRLLPAINRWAVTGTPIQKTIHDLQPLLNFIGFHEIANTYDVWLNLANDFLKRHRSSLGSATGALPLIDVLQKCMWRTCKSKVVDELQIPPQTEEVHRINMSNIEMLFYTELHEECEHKFFTIIDKYLKRSQQIRTISPGMLKSILQPLLKMRQCCSISVVSVGGNAGPGVGQKLFLQPKELNKHLVATNEMECKKELRTVVSFYNGFAGINFLEKEYGEAIKYYKEVLKLATAYKEMNISVDSLLQIHALHNLLEVHKASGNSVNIEANQIREYEENYNALEWKYLEAYATVLTTARLAAEEVEKKFAEIESTTENHTLNLVAELVTRILSSARAQQYENQLMNKIVHECRYSLRAEVSEMNSLRGVLYTLSTWYDKFTKFQAKLFYEFRRMKFFTENVRIRKEVDAALWTQMREFITSVYDCHLGDTSSDTPIPQPGQDNNNPKKKAARIRTSNKVQYCPLCLAETELNNLECLVFAKVLDEQTNQTEGVSSPSLEILLLKTIFTFVKSKPEFSAYAEIIDKQFSIMDDWQGLYKKFSKYWIEIEYTVKAYDELDMCKMRFTLTDNDLRSVCEITNVELPEYRADYLRILPLIMDKFDTKYRRLRYVKHLGTNTEELFCPICQIKIANRYTVLECGHSMCWECLRELRSYSVVNSYISCAICRNKQSAKTVYYAVCTPAEEDFNIPLVGTYSSKIMYMVRLILKLKNSHGHDESPLKILIFSQWKEILNAIAFALKTEDISYRVLNSLKAIDEFKNVSMDVTCLLMPLSKGSKGLNLIEATHVFLVEPILNPGEELQAIGRVHRFGQTKPTTVHRFITNNTIEDNIFKIVSSGRESQEKWEFENITVEDLHSFFKFENTLKE